MTYEEEITTVPKNRRAPLTTIFSKGGTSSYTDSRIDFTVYEDKGTKELGHSKTCGAFTSSPARCTCKKKGNI